jgi:hypothetical protein
MSEDWLRGAARSLRDEADEITPDEAARTRARVMASLTVVERRRNRAVLLFIPIAAVLAGSLALAHEGVTARSAWGWLAGRVSATREPARVEAPVPRRTVAEAPPAIAPEIPAPSDIATATTSPSAPEAPTTPIVASPAGPPPTRSKAVAAPMVAPSGPSASIDAPAASDETDAAGLALYRKAHRLHFVDHDYSASLAAWDEYLRAVPRGPLVVEARYNRAIALVRLGRDSEARTALEPFARGRVEGGYRQAEANALLDALDSRDH